MGGLFKKSTPKPAPPPPAPTADNSEVQAAAEAERIRSQKLAGRASTMLTGGDGVTEEVETAKKKLLGG